MERRHPCRPRRRSRRDDNGSRSDGRYVGVQCTHHRAFVRGVAVLSPTTGQTRPLGLIVPGHMGVVGRKATWVGRSREGVSIPAGRPAGKATQSPNKKTQPPQSRTMPLSKKSHRNGAPASLPAPATQSPQTPASAKRSQHHFPRAPTLWSASGPLARRRSRQTRTPNHPKPEQCLEVRKTTATKRNLWSASGPLARRRSRQTKKRNHPNPEQPPMQQSRRDGTT